MTRNTPKRALSFGAAAAHYDSIRPTYPPDAARWLLGDATAGPHSRGHVVDLAAGTGLLTRVILGVTSAIVTAVEPDPLMRARLAETTPSVHPIAGTAESMPFEDASVDAVVTGQAYHWFDKERAHAEVARIVRSGGVFAPVWNIRDETVGWVAEYSRLIEHDRGNDHPGAILNPGFGSEFGPVAAETFQHSVTMNADGLVALLASRSYYLTSTPERQTELAEEIGDLARGLPEVFEMPYITYCYRAVRR